MGIRIGVDIGIASVGWAVVDDEYQVLESGSNLFDSADASRNVDRRGFRQISRDYTVEEKIGFMIITLYVRLRK